MSGRLDGLVAIITGAARGQGAAEAVLFAAEGARLVLGDILHDDVAEVAASLSGQAEAVSLDITSEEDWAEAVAIAEGMGGVNVLVNNAGITRTRPLEHETADGFRAMWEVNVIGAFLGMRAVLDPMRDGGGGSIVNVSSTSGLIGLPYHGAYGASKWAMRGLSRTAAVEWGPHGIRVNTILPGPIATPMLPPPKVGTDANRFNHLPLGRAGTADEVANLAVFLASPESSYITGGELTIDGGSTAGPAPRYDWTPE